MTPSIRGDRGWDAKILDPPSHEGVDDGLGRDVGDGNGDGPAGEPVNRGEEVSAAVGERKRNQVEMDMVEAPVWDGKIANRRDCVACYFGTLAVEALARPSGHILAHRWPYDLCSDGLARTLDAGMSESVDDVEDGLAESQWYKWSCWTIADVHD